ncbi:glutamine amidotransferase-like class 1 domain-containing protein 1 [Anneissia japonica]|uniref:glutamine amidotransferase-like class 1 domain-containing protein 1 n=1 Tax=Anneissia japonica TaxID=1529436 RepID=UPI0014255DCC|nr:glutamine amidotransferase-like class 1 domain-containing protein 1 [Anneissia japonica]
MLDWLLSRMAGCTFKQLTLEDGRGRVVVLVHRRSCRKKRMAGSSKGSCLIIVSSHSDGVLAQSFIHSFTLTHSAFNVQLAAPVAKAIDFIKQDDNSRKWLNEFRTKPFATPVRLETIEASRYSALLFPDAPGALHDLSSNSELANIIQHFIHEQKPICAIGSGVAALCCVKDKYKWGFSNYSMTGPSVYELAQSSGFGEIPIILEDFIKDNDATFSGKFWCFFLYFI